MKLKTIVLVTILLIMLTTLGGAVSASQDNTTDDVAIDDRLESCPIDEDIIAEDSDNAYALNDTEGSYVNVDEAYECLNSFRTESGVWFWNDDDTTKSVFNTNETNRIQPLQRDTALEEVAEIRANELVVLFSHTRPDESICFTAYPDDLMACGENIAMGQPTCEDVIEDWKESDYDYDGQGHRRNMLDTNFNCVGIAGFKCDGVIYWVQAFGLKDNVFYNESRTSYEPATEPDNNQVPTNPNNTSENKTENNNNTNETQNNNQNENNNNTNTNTDDNNNQNKNNNNSNTNTDDNNNQNENNNNSNTNTDDNNNQNENNNNTEETQNNNPETPPANNPPAKNTKTKAKKSTKIVASKKTFKVKAKNKKYTITLKSGKKLISKVKVYLKVKGKTYKATTNKKGKATFNLKKLTKKGNYKITLQFKGNKNCKATTKKTTIKLK